MIASGIDEAKVYAEFVELAHEIKVPVIQLHYGMELRDKYGNIIEQVPKRMSHSFNRNAYVWMFSQLAAHPIDDTGSFGASYNSMKDTGGTVRNSDTYPMAPYAVQQSQLSVEIDTPGYGYYGIVALATNGIVIGTGSGAEGFSDYQLTTKIAHGNGATQMHYADTDDPPWAWDEGTDTMTSTFVRYFNNNSGDTIVVAEIGMYFRGLSSYYFMMARDLLGAPISCVDASQLKVTYDIDLIYPEGA